MKTNGIALLVIAVSLLTLACGGNDAGPIAILSSPAPPIPPPPDLAGDWTGTFTQPRGDSETVQVTLYQVDDGVSGQFSTADRSVWYLEDGVLSRTNTYLWNLRVELWVNEQTVDVLRGDVSSDAIDISGQNGYLLSLTR